MKSGKYVVRAIMILIFLGALAYFSVYAYHVFLGGYETAVVYSYTGQNTLPAQGYIFRQETVLPNGGNLEEIVAAEGENVAKGDLVARVYRSEQALAQHRELEETQTELERLVYIQSRGTEESDAMRLNQQIIRSITDLRADAAQGDYSKVDSGVNQLKELVFRRDYTYTSSSALDEQISALNSKVAELQNATEGATSAIYAPAAGIFSALVDGYESCFRVEELEELTAARLQELSRQWQEPSGQELGKVIVGFDWYYAAVMSQDVAKYLSSGDQAVINFEGSTGSQTMTVERISEPDERGQVAAVFRSNRYLSENTMLREQNVDVAYHSYDGLRIPARALRADQQTGQLGVYRLSGSQAKWVPVELLFTGNDYYLVRSVRGEAMSELQEAQMLRAGDEIIVKGKNLYDGKVIQ